MKIIKKANGERYLKLKKSEWEKIGKQQGWMKTAEVIELYLPQGDMQVEVDYRTESGLAETRDSPAEPGYIDMGSIIVVDQNFPQYFGKDIREFLDPVELQKQEAIIKQTISERDMDRSYANEDY